jgi:hypothetical protein
MTPRRGYFGRGQTYPPRRHCRGLFRVAKFQRARLTPARPGTLTTVTRRPAPLPQLRRMSVGWGALKGGQGALCVTPEASASLCLLGVGGSRTSVESYPPASLQVGASEPAPMRVSRGLRLAISSRRPSRNLRLMLRPVGCRISRRQRVDCDLCLHGTLDTRQYLLTEPPSLSPCCRCHRCRAAIISPCVRVRA